MHDLKCREGHDKEKDKFSLPSKEGKQFSDASKETILWCFFQISVNFLLVFLIGELHQTLAEAIAGHIIPSDKN